MNVNPDFGGQAEAFHPDAGYQISVDTDAGHRADVAFSFVFSESADGPQTVTVYRVTGGQARSREAAGETIAVAWHCGPARQWHTSQPGKAGQDPSAAVAG